MIYILKLTKNLHTPILCIFLISILNIEQSYAQLDRKSTLLNKNQSFLKISEEFSEIEREYESSTHIIDEAFSSGLITSIEYFKRVYWKDLQIGAGISYLTEGKNKNSFDENLSLGALRRDGVHNFGNPFIEFIKQLESKDLKYKHYIKSKFIIPITKKEHLYFDDKNIGHLSYLFTYNENNSIDINGELFTRYYGKIQTQKEIIGKESRESFTEVGFSFYPSFKFDNLTVITLLGFSLSTDYNTRNQYYSRLTDKGFSYYGGVEVRYYLPQYFISLEYYSSSFVFNTISDDVSNDIDYEIEKRSIKLNLGLLF